MKISIGLTLLNLSTLAFMPNVSLAIGSPLSTNGCQSKPQIIAQISPLLVPPNSNRFFEQGREKFEREIRLLPEFRQLNEKNPLQIDGELREGLEEMLKERGIRRLEDLLILPQSNKIYP